MTKYYKLKLYSDCNYLSNYNNTIIARKGLFWVYEIRTNARIIICDSKSQIWFYPYFVLRSDFKQKNIATSEEIRDYIGNIKPNELPKKTKRLIKKYEKK